MVISLKISHLYCLLASLCNSMFVFFFKQKTAYEMRISDWSSDVCSSDLRCNQRLDHGQEKEHLRLSLPAGWAPALLAAQIGPARPLRNPGMAPEIGRASCRERVCQFV